VTVSARAAGAATLILALAIPSGAAHAGTRDWTTVATLAHARLLACKEPTTKTGPWKVHVRVDGRKATKTTHGSAFVEKDGTRVGKKWRSGRVHPGEVSEVGTLRLPRGSAYLLNLQIATGTSGSATGGPASLLHRC
jgi:hypothetical protein